MANEFDYGEIHLKANENAAKLENASTQSVNRILDEINSDLAGKDPTYRAMVTAGTSDKLKIDGQLGNVLATFGSANFDVLAHGNRRISDKDLGRDQIELHNQSRYMEEELVSDMRDSKGDIQHSKREQVIFGLGNHGDIDRKRLDSFAHKEDMRNATELVMSTFGTPDGFDRLASGKGFITKNDLKYAIDSNSYTNRFNADEMSMMTLMQQNFKKMSQDSVDPADPYNRVITHAALDKFAAKNGVTWDSVQANQVMRSADAELTRMDLEDRDKKAPEPAREAPKPAEQAVDHSEVIAAARKDWDAQVSSARDLEASIRKSSEHRVNPGENLWKIASEVLKQDGAALTNGNIMAEVNHIKEINGLRGNTIFDKQVLKLYTEDETQERIKFAQRQADCKQ